MVVAAPRGDIARDIPVKATAAGVRRKLCPLYTAPPPLLTAKMNEDEEDDGEEEERIPGHHDNLSMAILPTN